MLELREDMLRFFDNMTERRKLCYRSKSWWDEEITEGRRRMEGTRWEQEIEVFMFIRIEASLRMK